MKRRELFTTLAAGAAVATLSPSIVAAEPIKRSGTTFFAKFDKPVTAMTIFNGRFFVATGNELHVIDLSQ